MFHPLGSTGSYISITRSENYDQTSEKQADLNRSCSREIPSPFTKSIFLQVDICKYNIFLTALENGQFSILHARGRRKYTHSSTSELHFK